MAGVAFLKGHGTENDFVVLPDPDNRLDLTPERVRALCDRHRGIGADGVLRVIPAPATSDARWFMDYRNADGSVAEMCGNGVRVFVRYLIEAGLAAPDEFVVGTRAGDRVVTVAADDPGTVTVRMGRATVTGTSTATLGGTTYAGVAVDVGNPHLACVIDPVAVDELDLTVAPGHDDIVFPHGVNVEFVNDVAPGTLRMRVHERGVGETRSCGTGTVAVVAAALHLAGESAGERTVLVPGGQVVVTVDELDSTLTGPAVLVASGELSAGWWADAAK